MVVVISGEAVGDREGRQCWRMLVKGGKSCEGGGELGEGMLEAGGKRGCGE